MNHYIKINNVLEDFRENMLQRGITPPEEIKADGNVQRFHIPSNKPGTKDGWYVLNIHSFPFGVFGDWKEGVSHKWFAYRKHSISPDQRLEFKKQLNQIHSERKIAHSNTAKKAEQIFYNSALANPKHPYLIRKQINSYNARQEKALLILPITDTQRKIWSVQYIPAYGRKWFLPGGKISKHFIPIQFTPSNDKETLICEGFATGATLAKLFPHSCVIAACNAGNLKPVAESIRRCYPESKITICCDDDRLNPKNPGITKGRAAAISVGALVMLPNWPDDAPEALTDFNDLSCWLSDKEQCHAC